MRYKIGDMRYGSGMRKCLGVKYMKLFTKRFNLKILKIAFKIKRIALGQKRSERRALNVRLRQDT